MERAKVFHVEDNEASRKILNETLKIAGHKVVFESDSVHDAKSKIPGLIKAGIDVAIVDGGLADEDQGGQMVVQEIRNFYGYAIKIIGHPMRGEIPGADINIPKTKTGSTEELLAYIKSL